MILSIFFLSAHVLLSGPATGCASGDCLNGRGVYQFASGARYEGQFVRGKRQGQGRLELSDGVIYEGQFQQDYRQGTGVQTWPDGARYTGQFLRDLFHGQGILCFSDGSRYTGQWQSGQMHGPGRMEDPEGRIREGEWVQGKLDNPARNQKPDQIATPSAQPAMHLPASATGRQGTYRYADGSVYEGMLLNGLPQGQGRVVYASGNRYTGDWYGHTPHGTGTMVMTDGRTLQGRWEHGRLSELTGPMQAIPEHEVTAVRDDQVRIWAVVAGIGNYPHMPALQYTDDDAYRMYAFLKSPEGGALPDGQIRLLINEEATRDDLLIAIQVTFGRADENDVVLFYFSGHGLDGALLPVDFDGFDNRIFYQELTGLLQASQARQKVIIADACYSGSLLAARGPATVQVGQLYDELRQTSGGVAMLLSSREEEYSLEDKGLRAGIFSYYLRSGLQGQADQDGDGFVRIGELFRYVQASVRSRSRQRQTPVIRGTFDENMPLAYLRPRG